MLNIAVPELVFNNVEIMDLSPSVSHYCRMFMLFNASAFSLGSYILFSRLGHKIFLTKESRYPTFILYVWLLLL